MPETTDKDKRRRNPVRGLTADDILPAAAAGQPPLTSADTDPPPPPPEEESPQPAPASGPEIIPWAKYGPNDPGDNELGRIVRDSRKYDQPPLQPASATASTGSGSGLFVPGPSAMTIQGVAAGADSVHRYPLDVPLGSQVPATEAPQHGPSLPPPSKPVPVASPRPNTNVPLPPESDPLAREFRQQRLDEEENERADRADYGPGNLRALIKAVRHLAPRYGSDVEHGLGPRLPSGRRDVVPYGLSPKGTSELEALIDNRPFGWAEGRGLPGSDPQQPPAGKTPQSGKTPNQDSDARMREERRRMKAGLRPEMVSEQEFAASGMPDNQGMPQSKPSTPGWRFAQPDVAGDNENRKGLTAEQRQQRSGGRFVGAPGGGEVDPITNRRRDVWAIRATPELWERLEEQLPLPPGVVARARAGDAASLQQLQMELARNPGFADALADSLNLPAGKSPESRRNDLYAFLDQQSRYAKTHDTQALPSGGSRFVANEETRLKRERASLRAQVREFTAHTPSLPGATPEQSQEWLSGLRAAAEDGDRQGVAALIGEARDHGHLRRAEALRDRNQTRQRSRDMQNRDIAPGMLSRDIAAAGNDPGRIGTAYAAAGLADQGLQYHSLDSQQKIAEAGLERQQQQERPRSGAAAMTREYTDAKRALDQGATLQGAMQAYRAGMARNLDIAAPTDEQNRSFDDSFLREMVADGQVRGDVRNAYGGQLFTELSRRAIEMYKPPEPTRWNPFDTDPTPESAATQFFAELEQRFGIDHKDPQHGALARNLLAVAQSAKPQNARADTAAPVAATHNGGM